MADATIKLERTGAVAQVVLSNPPLNLFTDNAFNELMGCLDEVEASDARALVWRADGDIFSGGVDVNAFQRIVDADSPESASGMAGPLIEGVKRLEALPIPTVALIHGLCLTAGLEIALGCDLFWAEESSKFGLVEAVVGLTPGAGGTQRMAERAGPARAREFVMTGGLYEAARLESWGVINRVVPDGTVHEKGLRFAERLASGPTKAHAATKRIVRALCDDGMERADEVTPGQFADLFATEDLQGAVRSFLADGPGKAKFEGK
jgi:enoyl-CoA hydratase